MGHRPILLMGVLIVAIAAVGAFWLRARGQVKATATPAEYARWRTELKNWGRWGPDDQRGATNLITPEKVLNTTKLVKSGLLVSLAHPEPQRPDPEVPPEGVFHRTTTGANKDNYVMDNYQVVYHGLAIAHADAFCHFLYDGKMYNGYSVAENFTPEAGCKKDDVMAWKDGIITRAVLYDIPQLKGVDYLEPGTPVTRADLEAWEKKSGVKVGPGDAIMLYVGRWKRRAAQGPSGGEKVAGYYADTIPFIKERDVAFLGHDFNIDWSPRRGWGAAEGVPFSPIHHAVLNWFGVGIVENLDLERAVETARRLNRYEFMLTFAPLPVEGGTGSPLNPIAVF